MAIGKLEQQRSFDENGNFTESYERVMPLDDQKVVITKEGEYAVVDSVLILKTAIWSFSKPELIGPGGISIVPNYHEIDFRDDQLILKPVYVFTGEDGHKGSLDGRWKMMKWTYHKTMNSEYAGRQEEFYHFLSADSVQYGWTYLDGSQLQNVSWKTGYQYSPPRLSIPAPGIYDAAVLFKNNKMYWYLDYLPSKYLRVN